jgi:hypothetical protein
VVVFEYASVSPIAGRPITSQITVIHPLGHDCHVRRTARSRNLSLWLLIVLKIRCRIFVSDSTHRGGDVCCGDTEPSPAPALITDGLVTVMQDEATKITRGCF